MANLGSENTPIEGESFGLPSGYSFDEENGDLVIRDTDGTVAMRRADGTWELESDLALNENDISGVGAFDSESVNTEEAFIAGQKSEYNWELLKDETKSGELTSASFNVPGDGVRMIWYEVETREDVDHTPSIRINNDGDSTENYNYIDSTGSESTSQNEFLLYNQSTLSLGRANGVLLFGRTEGSRQSWTHNITGAFWDGSRFSPPIGKFGSNTDTSGPIDNIEFLLADDPQGNETSARIKVYSGGPNL